MQKNGPARAKASGSDLHRGSLSDESASGLSDREAAPEHAVLPVLQGPQDGTAGADAGASPKSGSGTVIGACTFSCVVKAGHWARSRPTGSTLKNSCNCARSGRVVGRCW
jgi:hypothetical protein